MLKKSTRNEPTRPLASGGGTEARRRGRPSRVSYEAILDAAEKHAGSDWTLATIANELGVTVAAIYHYFPSREALLIALGQRVLALYPMPPMNRDWRIWLRALARSMYDVGVSHPFMVDAENFFRAAVGSGAKELEQHFAALESLGFAPEDCVTVHSLIGTVAMDHARARVMWNRHKPEMQRHVAMLNEQSSWFKIKLSSRMRVDDIEAMLDRALDVVIAGIEHVIAPRGVPRRMRTR